MAEQLKIVIDAEVQKAITNLKGLENSLSKLATGSVKQLEAAAAGLRNQLESLGSSALKSDFGKQLSSSLTIVENKLKQVRNEAGLTGEKSVDVFKKLGHEVKNFATFIPSLAIGAALGVAATFVEELVSEFIKGSDAAAKLKEAVDQAAGSMDKNAASVFVMVKALQSGTLSADEFKRVKGDLIKQAPEFQSSFDGDTISIDASDKALTQYINKLATTIKVSAALAIVNGTLSKSIATIAKGGEVTKIESITNLFSKLNPTNIKGKAISDPFVESVKRAEDALKTENISKLLDDTFKKLGISFKDFASTIDPSAIKKPLDDSLERARQFVKEFGDIFVVPDLDISFTNTKAKVEAAARKLLSDIDKGLLITRTFGVRKIQVPVELEFVTDENSLKKARENLFKNANVTGGKESKIIKGIVPGVSEDIMKRNQAFFDQFDARIKNTAALVTDTLTPAFTDMFDAILAGQNPLKAFFDGLKQAIVQVIKKLIAAAIAAAVLKALGGKGSFLSIFSNIAFGAKGGQANFGLGGAIGSRVFTNVIQIEGVSKTSGNDIVTSWRRTLTSNQRGG